MNNIRKISHRTSTKTTTEKEFVLSENRAMMNRDLSPISSTDARSTTSSQTKKLWLPKSTMLPKRRHINSSIINDNNKNDSTSDLTSNNGSFKAMSTVSNAMNSAKLSRARLSLKPRDKSKLSNMANDLDKATSPTPSFDYHKYLDRLSEFLANNYSNHQSMSQFYRILISKINSENDFSSLKAHYLFHSHIYSDTHIEPRSRYTPWELFIGNNTILPNLESRSTSSMDMMFLGKYNRYLNQRLLDYEKLKTDMIREELYMQQYPGKCDTRSLSTSSTGSDNFGKLLDHARCSLSQIRLVLDCVMPEHFASDQLLLAVYKSLAVDLTILLNLFCNKLILLLQDFFHLIRPDAEGTLFLYKEFTQLQIFEEALEFIDMVPSMSNANHLHLPSGLKNNDEDIKQLTKSLESYLYDNDNEYSTSTEHLSSVGGLYTPPGSPKDNRSLKAPSLLTNVGLASPDPSLLATPQDTLVEEDWATTVIDKLEHNATTVQERYHDYIELTTSKDPKPVEEVIIGFHKMGLSS